jgi:DNA-binding NtrC family response regulator
VATDADARIRETLARERGNVSRAARALGMHRTQLRRWLAAHGTPDPAPAATCDAGRAPSTKD